MSSDAILQNSSNVVSVENAMEEEGEARAVLSIAGNGDSNGRYAEVVEGTGDRESGDDPHGVALCLYPVPDMYRL